MEDCLILVDLLDVPVGEAGKLEAHQKSLLHRAFSVFLYRGDEMLIQKRAAGKYHSAGLWANTCCSHPRVGEHLEEEDLKKRILDGGKNKYRDAFLAANKALLENYARKMRKAVDEVNGNQRNARNGEGECRIEIFAAVEAGELEHRQKRGEDRREGNEEAEGGVKRPGEILRVAVYVPIFGVFFLSLIGGYPIGAKLIDQAVSKKKITQQKAKNMLF